MLNGRERAGLIAPAPAGGAAGRRSSCAPARTVLITWKTAPGGEGTDGGSGGAAAGAPATTGPPPGPAHPRSAARGRRGWRGRFIELIYRPASAETCSARGLSAPSGPAAAAQPWAIFGLAFKALRAGRCPLTRPVPSALHQQQWWSLSVCQVPWRAFRVTSQSPAPPHASLSASPPLPFRSCSRCPEQRPLSPTSPTRPEIPPCPLQQGNLCPPAPSVGGRGCAGCAVTWYVLLPQTDSSLRSVLSDGMGMAWVVGCSVALSPLPRLGALAGGVL